MKKNKILPTRFSIENTNYDADVLENLSTGKIHWHSHFLISIFIRGTGIQHLNNSEYKFHPGTAVLLGPFDFHYNETEETFDAYSIKFTHKIFNSRLYKECSPDHFPIVTELSERDFNLATTLCKFLIEEKNNPNSFIISSFL